MERQNQYRNPPVQASHLKTGKSVIKCSAKLKELFPEKDDTGTFIVFAFSVRSQVLSVNCLRNGVGKPVLHWGNGQWFDLFFRICGFLVFLMTQCNKSLLKRATWPCIARPMRDDRSFASSPSRRVADRGLFFFFFSDFLIGGIRIFRRRFFDA